MDDRAAQECFLLAIAGTSFSEIAALKSESERDVLLAVEREAAKRVGNEEFDSLNDALDYIRLGRLQRGLWSAASAGGVQETREVLDLIDRRASLTKKGPNSLTDAVQNMLHANNIHMDDSEEDHDE